MLVFDLLIPVVMIVAGRMMWKPPPKNINEVIGYRTGHSMKNMDTWKFAHNYCGKLWYNIGWIMFFLSIILHNTSYDFDCFYFPYGVCIKKEFYG